MNKQAGTNVIRLTERGDKMRQRSNYYAEAKKHYEYDVTGCVKIKDGIKYTLNVYDGRKIGKNDWYNRHGIQIVATDAITGKRRYIFAENTTPCLKLYETVACRGRIPVYMREPWDRAMAAAKQTLNNI